MLALLSKNAYSCIFFSTLRTTVANPDTREANIWIFITANTTGGIGSSGNNGPCQQNSQQKPSGAFAYTGSFSWFSVHIGLMLSHHPNFADYYNENQPFCLKSCCGDPEPTCKDNGCSQAQCYFRSYINKRISPFQF